MWKTIDEHPNYAVSSEGEVVNKSNWVKMYSRIKSGYEVIGIHRGGKHGKKHHAVHRLVAKAFVPNPFEKPFVNHLDGNKLNNHYWNLEWCTRLENTRHAIETGLVDYEDKGRRPIYQYDMDGKLLKEWKSVRFAGRSLGICNSTICATALGKDGRKQSGGFRWAFKDRVVPALLQ